MANLDITKNFAKSTVSTGYTSYATEIILVPWWGSVFPDPAVSWAFNLIWWDKSIFIDPFDDPNKEIVRCTAINWDTLTITRAQEWTLATNKNTIGSWYDIALVLTKKTIDDIWTELDAKLEDITSESIGDLSDVDLTWIANWKILQYNWTSEKFEVSDAWTWDMLASTYDPTSIEGDAFDMDNMVQGDTNKFISAAELTVLQATSGTNTGDQESSDFDIKDLTDSTDLRTTWNGKLDDITGESIGDLLDVDSISGITNGKILKWDTNKFIVADDNDTTYSASDFDIKDLTDSTNLKTTWSGKQDPLIAGTDYDVPLTFSTGLTRTGNTITNDITQYEDSDAVSAIKADEDWNASDWDTAYSWGNHASAGYLKDINSESIGDLEDVDLTDIANGKILKYNSTSENWECEDDAGGMTNPMTTAGDIIYGGADGTPTRLAKGTASQVLKMNSGATAPEWADESGGGTWGSITGTLSSQTDLQNALDDKQSIDETQTLTDGETVSWNMANGSCGILTLGGNRALANPTNIQAGRTYTLIVKQDANGSRELTFGNGFRFPGSTEPVLSSTASAVDILQFFAESTSVLHLTNFISDSKA